MNVQLHILETRYLKNSSLVEVVYAKPKWLKYASFKVQKFTVIVPVETFENHHWNVFFKFFLNSMFIPDQLTYEPYVC